MCIRDRVIDAGQVNDISQSAAQSVINGMSYLSIYIGAPRAPIKVLIKKLKPIVELWVNENVETSVVSEILKKMDRNQNPLTALSRFMAEVEGAGYHIAGSILDFKDALQTNRTWDQYANKGFTESFSEQLKPHVMKEVMGGRLTTHCITAFKALSNRFQID